jgi:hypothetical protein
LGLWCGFRGYGEKVLEGLTSAHWLPASTTLHVTAVSRRTSPTRIRTRSSKLSTTPCPFGPSPSLIFPHLAPRSTACSARLASSSACSRTLKAQIAKQATFRAPSRALRKVNCFRPFSRCFNLFVLLMPRSPSSPGFGPRGLGGEPVLKGVCASRPKLHPLPLGGHGLRS